MTTTTTTTTTSWERGTFVCVQGLQSEQDRQLNGTFGLTIGKPTDSGDMARRVAVFLFLNKSTNDNNNENDAVILEDAPTKKIKLVNLRPLTEQEEVDVALFRKAALTHVNAARERGDEQLYHGGHVFLCETCLRWTRQEYTVDVDASFLLASVVILLQQDAKDFHARKKDALRVLQILGPVVPLVLAGQSTSIVPMSNHMLAYQVGHLLTYSARYADKDEDIHYYFQQAWDCVVKCGENLHNTDENYKEQRNVAVGALQMFASMAGEYVSHRQPQGDPKIAAMVLRATEMALELAPEEPSNIVGMANTYYVFAQDYVQAARWYRKALMLPDDVIEKLSLGNARDFFKNRIVLAQLQLPDMPLDGVCVMHPVGDPDPSTGQQHTFACTKVPPGTKQDRSNVFGKPGGMQFLVGFSPPFNYTLPTTDPDDPNVFPPHVLELVVQPDPTAAAAAATVQETEENAKDAAEVEETEEAANAQV